MRHYMQPWEFFSAYHRLQLWFEQELLGDQPDWGWMFDMHFRLVELEQAMGYTEEQP